VIVAGSILVAGCGGGGGGSALSASSTCGDWGSASREGKARVVKNLGYTNPGTLAGKSVDAELDSAVFYVNSYCRTGLDDEASVKEILASSNITR